MKVQSYSLTEIQRLFSFDDETGVYYLEGETIGITIKSWNYLMNIALLDDNTTLSQKDLQLLHTIFTTFYFEPPVPTLTSEDDDNH